MLKINFADNIYPVEITPDTMLSELIARAGILLDLRCAGFGVCGRCRVELLRGKFSIEGKTSIVTPETPLEAPACHTEVCGTEAEISIPLSSVIHTDGQIAVDYARIPKPERHCYSPTEIRPPSQFTAEVKNLADSGLFWPPEALQQLSMAFHDGNPLLLITLPQQDQKEWVAAARTKPFSPLGIAIDIGTTTVAAVLLDLEKGEPLASVSAYNRQAICGDNVSSRISYSSGEPENLNRLRRLIVNDTINPLLRRLLAETNRSATEVVKVSIAGNTVMAHLFLGLSPQSIGVLPFLPVTRTFSPVSAAASGIAVNPAAQVNLLPAISGYVGGDITAGIMASGIHRNQKKALLIDIGTNCEIVLCDGTDLYACAAAAGPAFEGAGIACGSRAATGAIDRIQIDAQMQFTVSTIENAPPAGLCGSAIIDFLAEGFKCGLIDNFGRYNLELLRRSGHYLEVNYGHGTVHACIAARSQNGKPVYVSEADIEQVLKAKAAVYAGIKALLEQCRMNFSQLETVYLAGGFAKYLRVENAVELGMLPPLKPEIYQKIGNSSLAGAVMNTIDPDFAAKSIEVIDLPQMVELNTLPDFENHYIDALMIPNFNPGEFYGI